MWGEGGGRKRKDERKEGEREGKEGEREGKEGEREGKGERGGREGGGRESDVHVTLFFILNIMTTVPYSQHFDYLCQDLQQYYQYKQNLKTKKQTKGSSLQRQRGTDHR